jgi:hypothetical protein
VAVLIGAVIDRVLRRRAAPPGRPELMADGDTDPEQAATVTAGP